MESLAALAVGQAATATVGGAAVAGMPAITAALGAGGALTSFAAPTAGLFGFGGALTTMGVLKGASSVLGLMGQFAAGQQDAAALRQQAASEKFNARQEILAGLQASNEIRARAAAVQHSNIARAFASGIAPAASNILTAQVRDTGIAASTSENTELALARSRALARRSRARLLRSSASTTGLLSAAGSFASAAA